jgi:hypothetical protein
MSSISRTLSRAQDKAQAEDDPAHRKLPVGQIVSQPVKGDFLTLPLLGWVSVRAKTETPLVMLALVLFKSVEDPSPRGTLNIELPVLPETEMATVAALERYGWDGRVWPGDDGWPTGSEQDEANMKAMLDAASLKATLVFPAGDAGNPAQSVSVQRARGPFLMPPLPTPETDPSVHLVERLREICKSPGMFHLLH